MIVLVPVALRMPAMLVLIPPLMKFTPAVLASLTQFPAFTIGLGAVRAMLLDSLVQFMLRMFDPALATVAVAVFGVKSWDGSEQQSSCQDGA